MGGVNPYIAPAKVQRPTKKYKVTFLPMNVTAEVDPTVDRMGHDGLPLSILDIAEGAGVDIDHSCGGVCACSTCHVWVKKGFESLNEMGDCEEDILDRAYDVKPQSRLGCQAELDDQDVEYQITEESEKTWYDEHPKERHEAEAQGLWPPK
jgi:ferredoxin, 2Fe-2S